MDTDEVLSKHKTYLLEYARSSDLHIIATYEEVVSGESLDRRPQMLRLLEDVENELFDAVLVMDIDRLSRGRMRDQGVILDALKYSGTKIITPEKTYDLSDELDDELAEFKTFLSRREYKIINKRLRRGLHQAIQAGCYVANAPYGYRKITVDKKPTLEIVAREAEFVRMIYDLYVSGFGCSSIAGKINALGATPRRAEAFSRSAVAQILRNPTYIGKIVWNQKKHIRKGSNGKETHLVINQPREKWTIVDGLHPAIISVEQYHQVQEIMAGRYIPSKQDGTIKSALAGIVYCAKCGNHMQKMVSKGVDYLLCQRPGCCASAQYEYVEQSILFHLERALKEMEHFEKSMWETSRHERQNTALKAAELSYADAERRKAKLYELVENGTYDTDTFRSRMNAVKKQMGELAASIGQLKQQLANNKTLDADVRIQQLRTFLEIYGISSPAERNAMLKKSIRSICYTKPKKTPPTYFHLDITLL